MPDVEVRICPMGPPQVARRPVMYAWCTECEHVRKNTRDCPMIERQQREVAGG